MKAPMLHICREQHFWLSPYRTIFWEEKRALIISDLHLGKTGHFRKAGIAVPAEVFKEDLQRLFTLVQYFQPKEMLITGDFFHSHNNIELSLFSKWRKDLSPLNIHLVKGNHDILSENWYAEQEISCCGLHHEAPFSFVHDLADLNQLPEQYYPLAGHIHPGIVLSGAGKQKLRVPCFYFGNNFAILPAYSKFTGTSLVEPEAGDHVFAIAGDQLFKVQ